MILMCELASMYRLHYLSLDDYAWTPILFSCYDKKIIHNPCPQICDTLVHKLGPTLEHLSKVPFQVRLSSVDSTTMVGTLSQVQIRQWCSQMHHRRSITLESRRVNISANNYEDLSILLQFEIVT